MTDWQKDIQTGLLREISREEGRATRVCNFETALIFALFVLIGILIGIVWVLMANHYCRPERLVPAIVELHKLETSLEKEDALYDLVQQQITQLEEECGAG